MNFSVDGRVTPDFHKLPDTKEEQEKVVGKQFVEKGFLADHPNWVPRPMDDEAGHDFGIFDDSNELIVEVQAAEVVFQSFTKKITVEEFRNDPPREAIQGPQTKSGLTEFYLAVDREKLDNVICRIIQKKLSKHYAKQKVPLWLLIWTVTDYPELMANYPPGSSLPRPVVNAKNFLRNNDISPFERVYLFPLLLNPRQL